jgi:hypothetical protein
MSWTIQEFCGYMRPIHRQRQKGVSDEEIDSDAVVLYIGLVVWRGQAGDSGVERLGGRECTNWYGCKESDANNWLMIIARKLR